MRARETPALEPPPRRRLAFPGDAFSCIYAIGDVHGRQDLLLAAFDNIHRDAASLSGRILIVCLGDYVDRGPDSSAVLGFLAGYTHPTVGMNALCGNHDDSFLRFLEDPQRLESWLRFAGPQTLMSYGIDPAHAMERGGVAGLSTALERMVPERHRSLLSSMPVMVQVGTTVFVHAGIRPGVSLDEQEDGDLMWIRQPFLKRGPELPVTVVHGHSPSDNPVFGPSRIGIDTGAYATGRLTVLKIHDGETTVL